MSGIDVPQITAGLRQLRRYDSLRANSLEVELIAHSTHDQAVLLLAALEEYQPFCDATQVDLQNLALEESSEPVILQFEDR